MEDTPALENRRLKQELRLKPLTAIVTVIGAVAVLAAVFVERHFAREDELRQRHIERMTQIATEVDDLFKRTFVTQAGDAWNVRQATDTLTQALNEVKLELGRSAVIDEAILRLSEFQKAIESDTTMAKLLFGQVAIGAEWRIRRIAPTPDFALLFGENLAREWQQLSNDVHELLPSLELVFFVIRSDSPVAKKLEVLRERGFEFRGSLLERIESRSGESHDLTVLLVAVAVVVLCGSVAAVAVRTPSTAS